jgi:hypothetical protein
MPFCAHARYAQHRLELITEDLDGNIPAYARKQFIEADLDRLAELVAASRQRLDGLFQLLKERLLAKTGVWPLFFLL